MNNHLRRRGGLNVRCQGQKATHKPNVYLLQIKTVYAASYKNIICITILMQLEENMFLQGLKSKIRKGLNVFKLR